MPNGSRSSASSRTAPRGPVRGLAACLALLVAATGVARAAVTAERRIDLTILPDGFERTEFRLIDLVEEGDRVAWSRYSFSLDQEDDTLVSCSAEVLDARGRVVDRVGRTKLERVESVGDGLYSSDAAHVIPFPPLQVGQRLRIEIRSRHRSHFPATDESLTLSTRQEALSISVSGAPPALRWRVDDARQRFTAAQQDGVLRLTATGIAADGPVEAGHGPAILRLAWDDGAQWSGIGRWYEHLLEPLPKAEAAVVQKALDLTRGLESPRARLEALADFVKRGVRYESVALGVGGWRPAAPGVVLGRAWGDCKDKSLLLSDMLRAVGIPSRLVLLRSGEIGHIDDRFPTPFQFNHCILGVPAGPETARDDDPVAEGLLLIDPTMTRGGVAWLASSDQGRLALVVDGDASRLVRTPVQPGVERRSLEIEGTLDPASGDLLARARLEFRGDQAEAWIVDLASRAPARTEEDLRQALDRLIPGARLSALEWRELPGPIPGFEGVALVRLPAAARGEGTRRTLLPRGFGEFPEPGVLRDRVIPLHLRPGVSRTEWRINLPAGWCPPAPLEESTDNAVGRFALRVTVPEANRFVYERLSELRLTQVDPVAFVDLMPLSAAEHRAGLRSVRLRCEPPAGEAAD